MLAWGNLENSYSSEQDIQPGAHVERPKIYRRVKIGTDVWDFCFRQAGDSSLQDNDLVEERS